MLGPMGAHVMSVLRVMTPAEIDRYAKTSGQKKVQAMAAGAEDLNLDNAQSFAHQKSPEKEEFKPLSTEAEIIPIKGRDSEPQKEHQEKSFDHQQPSSVYEEMDEDDEVQGNGELESLGIYSSKKISAFKKAQEKKRRSKEDSSSVFLLKQREKLKKTNHKMIGNVALKTYSQTMTADMTKAEVDIDDPDKELAEGSRGILVNKKHY